MSRMLTDDTLLVLLPGVAGSRFWVRGGVNPPLCVSGRESALSAELSRSRSATCFSFVRLIMLLISGECSAAWLVSSSRPHLPRRQHTHNGQACSARSTAASRRRWALLAGATLAFQALCCCSTEASVVPERTGNIEPAATEDCSVVEDTYTCRKGRREGGRLTQASASPGASASASCESRFRADFRPPFLLP